MKTLGEAANSSSISLSKLSTAVILILLLFISSIGRSTDTKIPNEDPSREWLGSEYAEVVFSEFRRLHPEIKLVFDLNDIEGIKGFNNWSFKDTISKIKAEWKSANSPEAKANQSVGMRLVGIVKSALPDGVLDIARKLENGRVIQVKHDFDYAFTSSHLSKWLLGKPDNSVGPHELMIEALRLGNGHVFLAWAAVWNLSRENWEAASVRNYGAMTSKLISLTGERHLWNGAAHYIVSPKTEWTESKSRVEILYKDSKTLKSTKRLKMVITKRGDEFSYLYHRVGVELFSLIIANLSDSPKLGWIAGNAGAIGEFLSYTQTAGLEVENRKRVNNDRLAASSGVRFFELAAGKVKPKLYSNPPGASTYLKSNNLKFGNNYKLPEDRPAQYFGSRIDKKFFSDTMSEQELEMRLQYATEIDSKIFDPIMLASTGEAERLHRGLIAYSEAGAKNENINKYIRNWLDDVRAYPFKLDVDIDLTLDSDENILFVRELKPDLSFDDYNIWLNNILTRVLKEAEENKAIGSRSKNSEKPTVINSCKKAVVGTI